MVVDGAPATPVLVGASVQLTATPLNASGGVVASQTLTWQSSDPAVATVSAGGLVTVVGPGSVTITAAVRGGGGGTATLDARAGGPLGPDGGTLTMLGGAVTIVAPRGSLAQTSTLLLRPAVAAPPEVRLVPGTAYDLGPETLAFVRPATITLRYDASRVPSAAEEVGLQLYVRSGGTWTLSYGSVVNTVNKTVSGTLLRGGTYAIIGTPVSRIALRGPLVGGGLYVGSTGRLSTRLTDVNGDSLTGRRVQWTSSDPQRVTVDDGGTVTAVAPGAATITAMVDGVSAATTLTVIARPTPEWGPVGDWTTLQGNARHTGFVAATLDPVSFRERWVATVRANTRLHPVATGGGRVFVSTHTDFDAQSLAVIDAGTGTVSWSRDFGRIHSLNPPAYAEGRVYVMTGGHEDSFLWIFDAADGTVRSRTAYGNQWSTWGAPVVSDGGVYTMGGYYGGMYRFDARSGAQSYFRESPAIAGWSLGVSGGLVYVFGGPPATGGFGLTAINAASGTTAYQIADRRLPNSANMVLGDEEDAFGVFERRLLGIDLRGRAVRWEQRGSYTGTPAVGAGTVYAFNGAQVEARAPGDGGLRWAWTAPEGAPTGSMVVTRNLLFVSTASMTYAVDVATQKQVWSYPAGGHLALSAEGTLLIAQSNGKLAAIAVR